VEVVSVDVMDALTTGRLAQARAITFEYVASTQGEAGLPVPQAIRDLPQPLRTVLESLDERHQSPGALLLALQGETVCGTVALQRSWLSAATDAVVQRLYVREAYRRQGIAGRLMAAVHEIAAREGFQRLILNVMASRAGALACYETLGYTRLTETLDWPYGGVWLGRRINS
jgi:GNAT superfamily N-acetyltransferase